MAEEAEADSARYQAYYDGVVQEAKHRLNRRRPKQPGNMMMKLWRERSTWARLPQGQATLSVRDETGTTLASGSNDMLAPPAARLSVTTMLVDVDGPANAMTEVEALDSDPDVG